MELPYHIFYTDDDKEDQDLFSDVVEEINCGAKLHLQDSGDQLLRALNNPPPHPSIIFLDLNMPEKDGFMVLEEIRSATHSQKATVIIFSTSDDAYAVRRSLELGANYYLPKPRSYDGLRDAVKYVLGIDWTTFLPDRDHFVYLHN